MSKNSLVIIIVILIAILAGGGFYLWQNSDDETTTSDEQTTEVTDEAIPDEEEVVVDDQALITQALANKYSKDISEVDTTVGEISGNFANGSVSFAGEMGGGWWLAFKEYDSWIIVADGNGTVMCADIESYDFPVSLVPECWDEATAELVTR